MTINKILSIGSCCEGLFMTKKLGLRYPGPVDNLGLKGFKYTYKLFNNEFYKSVILNEYSFWKRDNIYYNPWEENNHPVTFFGINKNFDNTDNYFMMHNDYRQDKVKKELIKRIKSFYKYIDHARYDKSLFFIYSIIYEDENITDNEIQQTLEILPDYVKNRLIILECGRLHSKCAIENYFPVFHDKIRETNDIALKLKFYKWWLKNKYFYENQNNTKYDELNYE